MKSPLLTLELVIILNLLPTANPCPLVVLIVTIPLEKLLEDILIEGAVTNA